jgi:hypothetical protein
MQFGKNEINVNLMNYLFFDFVKMFYQFFSIIIPDVLKSSKTKHKKRLSLSQKEIINQKIKEDTGKKNKMHSRCFGIMGGHGNVAFNLSVELRYGVLSLRL